MEPDGVEFMLRVDMLALRFISRWDVWDSYLCLGLSVFATLFQNSLRSYLCSVPYTSPWTVQRPLRISLSRFANPLFYRSFLSDTHSIDSRATNPICVAYVSASIAVPLHRY